MRAMILAAGRGKRLGELGERLPKALLKAGGQTLLERHFAALRKAGVEEVVINLGWLGEKIEEFAGNGQKYGLRLNYSREGQHTLGTGGGVMAALDFLGEGDFILVNADVFTNYPLQNLLGWQSPAVLAVPRPSWRRRGDFDLQNGRVKVSGRKPPEAAVSFYSPAYRG